MALPVLVAVVAAGVSLIVLAVHFTGGTRNAALASEEVAIERFRVDYPDANVKRCHMSADRHVSVLELDDGAIGLVHAVGSKYLTRKIRPGDIAASANFNYPASVQLKTGDITWPRAVLNFDDEQEARTVAALFVAPDAAQRAA